MDPNSGLGCSAAVSAAAVATSHAVGTMGPSAVMAAAAAAAASHGGAAVLLPDEREVRAAERRLREAQAQLAKFPRYRANDYAVEESDLRRSLILNTTGRQFRGEAAFAWALSLVIGLLNGVAGFLFNQGIYLLNKAKFETTLRFIRPGAGLGPAYGVYLAFSLLYAAVAAALGSYVSPQAAGSGIPEIRCYLNGIHVRGLLTIRTFFAKAFGVLFSIAAGLVVGKEGPFTHVGAIIGGGVAGLGSTSLTRATNGRWRAVLRTRFGRYFRSAVSHRDYVAAGAAAGVSSAFGSPIGGILFSVEQGASFFNYNMLAHAFLASGVAIFVSLLLTAAVWQGPDLYRTAFSLPQQFVLMNQVAEKGRFWYYTWEMPIFAAMGVGGGLAGAGMVVLNNRVTRLRRRHVPPTRPARRVAEVVALAAATATAWLLAAYASPCAPLPPGAAAEAAAVTEPRSPKVLFAGLYPQLWCPEGQYSEYGVLFFLPQTAAISLLFQYQLPSGSHFLFSLGALATMASLAWFFMSITFGIGAVTGLFVPSLLVGGAGGRLIGRVVRAVVARLGLSAAAASSAAAAAAGAAAAGGAAASVEVCLSTYAVVGGAAVLGGVSRMLLCNIVIAMETSGASAITVPLIAATWVAKMVADALAPRGIFDVAIERAGYPYLEAEPTQLRDVKLQQALAAGDVMSGALVTLPAVVTIGQLVRVLRSCPQFSTFPLVEAAPAAPDAAAVPRRVTAEAAAALGDSGPPHPNGSAAQLRTPGASAPACSSFQAGALPSTLQHLLSQGGALWPQPSGPRSATGHVAGSSPGVGPGPQPGSAQLLSAATGTGAGFVPHPLFQPARMEPAGSHAATRAGEGSEAPAPHMPEARSNGTGEQRAGRPSCDRPTQAPLGAHSNVGGPAAEHQSLWAGATNGAQLPPFAQPGRMTYMSAFASSAQPPHGMAAGDVGVTHGSILPAVSPHVGAELHGDREPGCGQAGPQEEAAQVAAQNGNGRTTSAVAAASGLHDGEGGLPRASQGTRHPNAAAAKAAQIANHHAANGTRGSDAGAPRASGGSDRGDGSGGGVIVGVISRSILLKLLDMRQDLSHLDRLSAPSPSPHSAAAAAAAVGRKATSAAGSGATPAAAAAAAPRAPWWRRCFPTSGATPTRSAATVGKGTKRSRDVNADGDGGREPTTWLGLRRAVMSWRRAARLLDAVDNYPAKAPADSEGEEALFARLRPADLEACLDLRHYMQRVPYVVPATASLASTYRLFRGLGLHHIFVTPPSIPIIGLITRSDIAHPKAYCVAYELAQREQQQLQALLQPSAAPPAAEAPPTLRHGPEAGQGTDGAGVARSSGLGAVQEAERAWKHGVGNAAVGFELTPTQHLAGADTRHAASAAPAGVLQLAETAPSQRLGAYGAEAPSPIYSAVGAADAADAVGSSVAHGMQAEASPHAVAAQPSGTGLRRRHPAATSLAGDRGDLDAGNADGRISGHSAGAGAAGSQASAAPPPVGAFRQPLALTLPYSDLVYSGASGNSRKPPAVSGGTPAAPLSPRAALRPRSGNTTASAGGAVGTALQPSLFGRNARSGGGGGPEATTAGTRDAGSSQPRSGPGDDATLAGGGGGDVEAPGSPAGTPTARGGASPLPWVQPQLTSAGGDAAAPSGPRRTWSLGAVAVPAAGAALVPAHWPQRAASPMPYAAGASDSRAPSPAPSAAAAAAEQPGPTAVRGAASGAAASVASGGAASAAAGPSVPWPLAAVPPAEDLVAATFMPPPPSAPPAAPAAPAMEEAGLLPPPPAMD